MATPCLFSEIQLKRLCDFLRLADRVSDQLAYILTHNVQRFDCERLIIANAEETENRLEVAISKFPARGDAG